MDKNYLRNELKTKPIPVLTESDKYRFWGKATLTANPDKCWDWTAFKHRGYGSFWVTQKGKGLNVRATRISYFLHYHIDPIGKLVLHKCDNPSCVNPLHLELGTCNDNMQDMIKKGRKKFRTGANHAQSKLTQEIVDSIRLELKLIGTSQELIAKRYGVNQSVISRIKNKDAWKHD